MKREFATDAHMLLGMKREYGADAAVGMKREYGGGGDAGGGMKREYGQPDLSHIINMYHVPEPDSRAQVTPLYAPERALPLM